MSVVQRIADTPEHGYTIVTLSGDRAKMFRLRGIALTMREDDLHVPIFFRDGQLTIYFPTSHLDAYNVFT